jgi:hypothetical protein
MRGAWLIRPLGAISQLQLELRLSILRKLMLAAAVLLLMSSPTRGQFSKLEVSRLHERLKLPATATITTALGAKLPASPALKVYVATSNSDPTYKYFVESFDKWNKKDGRSYGPIQAVSDLSQADVILALYRVREGGTLSSNPTAGGQIPGVVLTSPNTGRPPLRQSLPDTLYSYLITRKNDAFEIIYRDVVPLSHPDPETRVLNELKKRMKKR